MDERTAITGTPGVGKTTVSHLLKEKGYVVMDLNGFLSERGLSSRQDPFRDTYMVDTEEMKAAYTSAPTHDIVEGHLSHHLELPVTIVLRCSPEVLERRMESKEWKDEKKRENIQSEILDVILIEALENSNRVFEIDTSQMTPKEVCGAVIDILEGKEYGYRPGSIDWTEFMENYR